MFHSPKHGKWKWAFGSSKFTLGSRWIWPWETISNLFYTSRSMDILHPLGNIDYVEFRSWTCRIDWASLSSTEVIHLLWPAQRVKRWLVGISICQQGNSKCQWSMKNARQIGINCTKKTNSRLDLTRFLDERTYLKMVWCNSILIMGLWCRTKAWKERAKSGTKRIQRGR